MKTSPSVNTHLNKINKKIVVPRHRRDRNGSARQMGMKAEQAFWCCCQKEGYKWENASKAQNCTEHIDCFITKDGKTLSVDVKSAKKIARYDSKPQDKLIWVEWTARDGRIGWARAAVDYIAFQMLSKQFLMVKNEELRAHVEPLIEQNKHIVRPESQKDAVNGVLWKRAGNKDEMTLIPSEDLALLPSSFFM